MPRICFVPGCKTASKSKRSKKSVEKSDEKRLAIFRAPKDPVLRKQWHIASRRGDRELTERDYFCELHFTEDCIERYFTTELYDGETFKLERDRPALKKGSVPTIFSFPICNSVSKRGRPKKLCIVQNKENGSRDFDLKKRSSPTKFPSQVVVCSAYGCTNSSDKQIPGISFHRFPTNKRRKTWISAVGREDWQPSKESVLCSAHFTSDQIEQTGSSVRLKSGAIPTIFSFGEEQEMTWLTVNLQKDFYDSSHSAINDSYSEGINDFSVQDSDDDEVSLTETDYFVQEENGENSEEMSSSDANMPSKYFISENLIVEGHEEVFGKFVASELKILSCDRALYVRTKEKIWQVLEEASQMRVA